MFNYAKLFNNEIIKGILLATIVCGINLGSAVAGDIKGSEDHPLISRYEGSYIETYKVDTFNEYPLLINSIKEYGGVENNPDSVMPLEGRITRLRYVSPPERTTLEVIRNYEKALSGEGFEVLYSCKNEECGGLRGLLFLQIVAGTSSMTTNDQRYLAAKLHREEGDVYVSLFLSPNKLNSSQGVWAQLHVIEVEPMQENMVTVDADAMAKGIGGEGRIALYGILFDVNKATIKPESNPTLEQISTLLNDNPDLKLVIVGHTDNQGELNYNMDLSTRRAKSVEATLVSDYGMAKDRLSAWGVGYLSPVASNRNEAGRAKNRRVELVEE